MNQSIHFETLGCRLNQDETEGAARCFAEEGFATDLEPLTSSAQKDLNTILSVVNTCTVTGKAEQKARRIIRLVLDKYPAAPVIVTGCYAQVDAASIKAICPERIAVLPGTQKSVLASIAKNFSGAKTMTADAITSFIKTANLSTLTNFTLYTSVFQKHSRASIKIEDGCNNSCAFCRIHLARGKATSLDVTEVLARVQQLEEQGMNEVVFTGVNLSQYAGRTNDGDIASFATLLKTLIANTHTISFRISSYYPQCIDESLVEAIRSPRVQPSFHLSIQSGSDRILKLMNRPYTAETVVHAVELLRAAKDNPFIACDIIAGFPGETEDDFERTKELCKTVRFSWIHAFPFSPRPGTTAATMTPKVPERIKDERVAWLTECAVHDKIAYINSFKDRPLDAIVENSRNQRTASSAEQKVVHVVTSNFLHVACPQTDHEMVPGSVVRVKITAALEDDIRSGKEIEATGIIC
jgi:threonylcarbamoyladenosine tRNA methylthiotransferase MtaB